MGVDESGEPAALPGFVDRHVAADQREDLIVLVHDEIPEHQHRQQNEAGKQQTDLHRKTFSSGLPIANSSLAMSWG